MRIAILTTSMLLCSLWLTAQTGTIRGNIYDKNTGEPILYANIFIEGTQFVTNSYSDGFFSLNNVPVGTHTLLATYIGYDSLKVEVIVTEGQIQYKSLYMEESTIQLSTVSVSGKKEIDRSEVQISALKVTAKQIKSIPSTGGEADIAQYLQVIPGVISTGDQGGQIYIRGGSPVQNLVLLDGMPIYNPFHSIGFFSVFETEAIRRVDVLTGGFDAEYGGRISAIVDIKTREGNKKRTSGLVSVNPFIAKALLEGPVIPLNESSGTAISYLFTAKHSYIDNTSKVIYPYASSDSLGLPFNFTDLYGKITISGSNGSKLNLFGFNFTDRVNYPSIAAFDWKASGGGANFTLIPASSSLVIDGTVGFSDYQIGLKEADEEPRTSSISGFNVNLNFTYFGNNSELKYGLAFNGFTTDLKFRNFLGITFNQEENTTELAGFLKYRQKLGRVVIEPSVRAQYYASLSNFSFEPRLGLKYNVTDEFRLKAAGGFYSQNLLSTVNERDIVNLFVGFLSGPEQIIYNPGTRTPTDHRLQKAFHAIAGFEWDIFKNTELNVEPYYKGFTQLINVNRNKLTAQDPNYAVETGEAYGIDFLVKYQTANWLLWGGYSLGYVNRDDGEQVYPTVFDRRHNMNLLATYAFGHNNTWELSGRWNFGTGFPFTQTQGFFGEQLFPNGLDTDYRTENPSLGIIYDEVRNGGRLPSYHRLDFSLTKTWEFTKYSSLKANFSVTNAYNRANIFYFDRVRYERVDQLPILPSLGLTYTF